MRAARRRSPCDGIDVSDQTASRDAVEAVLDREIDGYRSLLTKGEVKTALGLLRDCLNKLPPGASGRIVFRVKSNIGSCHLRLGDRREAQRWLCEAYDAARDEPKAIANKALALIIGDRSQEAFDLCREALKRDPGNEHAAVNLLLAAIPLDVDEPELLVPPALLEREEVRLSRVVFLRGRQKRPDWWRRAAQAAVDFPGNERIVFFASEAVLEEITRASKFSSTRRIATGDRSRLSDAATAFEAAWKKAKGSDVADGEMAIAALHGAMLGRQLLSDIEAAIGLAGELIARTSDPVLLSDAVQVAFSADDRGLAATAIDKLGDAAQASFYRAMIHLQGGKWAQAAKCFAVARVPDAEKQIAATVIALAPMCTGASDADEAGFAPAFTAAQGNPRCLVLVARFATERVLTDFAAKAFDQAMACLGQDSKLIEQSVVAAYASRQRAYDVVIGVLGGHVDEDRFSEELLLLAEAHASEKPPRERNRDFFDRLPPPVRDQPEIAGFRASMLMQTGRWGEVEALFRAVRAQRADDPYPVLGLEVALNRLGRSGEASEAVAAADENAMRGPPAYLMQLAHALKRAGKVDRSLRYAYDLVRANPDYPSVVVGYIALILGDRHGIGVREPERIGAECYVELRNDRGEVNSFVIDGGVPFFGIDVRSPAHESARRVMGLTRGDSIDVPKGPLPPERWTVTVVMSKFLHLLQLAMDQFNRKFPGHDAIWSLPRTENGVADVLKIVRVISEANEQRAKIYTEGEVSLAFTAKMMGGNPVSFAQYLVSRGHRIATCTGAGGEFSAAGKLARERRGRGAVLDFYTAWVAAELGILPILRVWFGRLVTPESMIDELDLLIAGLYDSRGRRSMTVGWRDDQFVRHDVTDDFIDSQVSAVQAIRTAIVANCEVLTVLAPNHLSDLEIKVADRVGPRCLDAIHLARHQRMILLSDDLHYREMAFMIASVPGVWLQAMLAVALADGIAERTAVTRAYVGLAARKHDHLYLEAGTLRDVFDDCPDAALAAFGVILDFIGGPRADMQAHAIVAAQFLRGVWNRAPYALKVKAATGMILTTLLRWRTADWFVWVASLCRHVREEAFHRYVRDWLKGHLLPEEPVSDALNRLAPQDSRFPPPRA